MIDGIGRLAQLIQQRVDTRVYERAPVVTKNSVTATNESLVFIELLARVAKLDPNDPERERKAFRFFLEASLVSELGPALVNDPKFDQLIDTVQNRMEQQPELLAATQHAARLLLTICD